MAALIRSATVDDFAAMAELFRQLDEVHHHGLPLVFREAAASARSPEYLQSLLCDSNVAVQVAELDGLVVGLAHVQEVSFAGNAYFVPARYAQVRDVVVREASRHLGLGAALMAEAERWAEARGIEEVLLMVWDFAGSALSFYQALGYETLHRTMVKRLGGE